MLKVILSSQHNQKKNCIFPNTNSENMPLLDYNIDSDSAVQEHLYKLSFENAAVGIAHLNHEGRFIKVNNKVSEITGYTKDELLQKTFHEITYPDDLIYGLKEVDALFQRKKNSYTIEKRYIKSDKSLVWIKVTGSAVFNDNNEFIVYIAIIEDITEQKSTEKQLKKQKEKLGNVLNSITDCYISLDNEWRILEINKQAEKNIFQLPATELLGKVIWDLYPKGRGDIFHREYERALRENVPVHFEANSNVTDKWLEVHAFPRNTYLEIYFRDVTKRKNLEDALFRSEKMFADLFFNSPAFIVISDAKTGKIIEANEAYSKMTGYSREELIGKNPVELGLIARESRDKFANEITEIKSLQLAEVQIFDRYQEVHSLLFSSATITINNENCFLTSGIDISELKKAEEALHKNEQYFKIASAAANIGSFWRDLQTGEDYWSPEMLKIYGLKTAESFFLKDGIPETVHPDDREKVLKLANHFYNRIDNNEFNSEHRIILPDGTKRWVNVRGIAEYDNKENPVKIFGIVMDITERKNVEHELLENESKLRLILENSQDGIHVVDLKKQHYTFMSPSQERLTGFTREELNFSLDEAAMRLHPDDVAHVNSYLASVSRGKEEPNPMEYRWKVKSGEYRWFSDSRRAVLNENREPIALVGISRDITQLKKAEADLKNNQQLLQKILQVLPLGVFISDEKGNLVQTNRAAEKLWGGTRHVPLEQLKEYKGWWRNTGNRIKSEEWAFARAFLKGETSENEIIDIECFDGSRKTILNFAAPVKNDRDEIMSSVAVAMDITEEIKSEEALLESEEKFRLLANNISQLAWMMDKDGWVFWYNQRWLDYTGMSYEDMQGWGWQKVHHSEHIDRVIESKKQAIANGKVWEELFPLRNAKGKYRWFLTRAVPVKDEKGTIIRWLGTNTDVTEQRNIEMKLKNDSKLFEDLLYIAAHDLKGPVANIHGALDLMDTLSTEKKLMFLNRFRDLANQLDSTIQGVTGILRMKNNENSAAAVIQLENILNTVLKELNSDIPSLTYSFEKPEINYIEIYLYSILKNLISNSIKYCNENIPLKIDIISKNKGDYTLLSVSDNGIGINMEVYGDKLFSPFQRVHSKKAKGTGIGLYLIKDIIEKNDGYIEVESTPGKGTTFHCYLKEY